MCYLSKEEADGLLSAVEVSSNELKELQEEYDKMKIDYNKRRSQAKRYQKSAKRRHKYVVILENENARLKNEVFQWQNNHDEQVRRKTVCREVLEERIKND